MKKSQPPPLTATARVIAAAQFAAFKHRTQRRKNADASPYINHPLMLASILALEGLVDDADVLVAAILHDTIEDTKTTRAELERNFGAAVADLVVEVTDVKSQSSALRKHLQVEHAPRLSDGAKLVKLADKIANLRDIVAQPPAGWDLARKQGYFDWAKRVVDGLRGVHPKLEAVFDRVQALRPSASPRARRPAGRSRQRSAP